MIFLVIIIFTWALLSSAILAELIWALPQWKSLSTDNKLSTTFLGVWWAIVWTAIILL